MVEPGKGMATAQIDLLNILDNIKDGFWVLSEQGDCLYINQQQAELLGKPKEDILGQNIWQLFPQLKTTEIDRQFHRVLTQQIPINFEYLDPAKQRWYEYRLEPTNEGISIFTIDITDRKQSEALLRENLEQFQAFMNHSPASAWIVNQEGRIMYLSPTYYQMFQFPQEEVIGKTISEIYPPEIAQEFLENNQRVFATRQVIETIESAPRSEGKMGKFLVYKFPIFTQSGELLLGGVAIDITERKQVEESLKTANQQITNILESITDAFIAFNRQWRYTYVNQEASRLLGRSPEDLLGKHWQEVSPQFPRENPRIYHELQRAVTQQITIKFEIFSPSINRWLEITAFPFPEGLAIYFRDITKRKQEEQRTAAHYGVTRVLADATTLEDAVPKILQSLCESLEWQLGVIWSLDTYHHQLRYVNSWYTPTINPKDFIEANQNTTFEIGKGLPGRIWAIRRPIWITQLNEDDNFPRATSAAKAGLEAVFGFPICLGHEILGVIECFSDRPQEPDQDLLQLMGAIGSQIGQFMERKRTETALRESQDLFESFMTHSPLIAFIKDETGRHIYVNAPFEQLFKRSKADLVGKTDGEIYPPDAAQQFRDHDLLVLDGGKAMEFLETIGENAYMSFKFPFQNASRQRLLAGVAIDISQRLQAEEALRLSEERFRLATRAVNGLIYDWNVITGFVYRSEGLYSLIGVHPDEAAPTREWWSERIHPEDRALIRPVMLLILQENSDRYEFEYRIRHEDGRWIDIWDRGYLVRDLQGAIVRVVGSTSDITARKQAEEALRQTEARLYVALKNSPVTVFNQDLDLRYTWIYNPAFNYSVDFIIGKGEEELFYGSNVSELTEIKRRVLESGMGAREEVKIDMPDADYYYDLTVEPLRDANNQIIGITSAAVDISERKQMELAIRKSETVLNAFLTSSPIGMAFLDQELRYIYVNEALANINGVPLNEHFNRTVWDVLPAWASQIQEVINQVIESKEPLLNQEVSGFTHPSAQYRHCLVSHYPVFLPTGEVLGVGITSMDITDLKRAEQALRESEQLYRSLVEASCQIVWRTNGQGELIEVEGWEEFTGQPVEELLAGSREALHPDDLQRVLEAWSNAFNSKSPFEVEHRLRKYDGTYEYFAVRAIPVLNRGEIYAWVGMTTNIHQRKQAEIEREQLLKAERQAREEAEKANRIKDEFLAVLSHELRSPLNPILGWTQMLRTYKLDEKATQQALETIERNAKLQAQLIEDLLDISRILRGKMVLNIASVKLVNVIEAALETVQLAAEAKGIQIQTRFNGNVGQVLGDSARLQQVVWNLLSNSVKFTPSGGKVEISLQPAGTEIEIQVKDSGKGISREFLPHVFDYFRQEDSKTTRKFGGLGLGLAITRHLTELHGGTVQADSPGEGLGATFTVKLPLTATKPTITQDLTLPEDMIDLSQLKILVVDDEADMRELLTFMLFQYGAQVRVAASATEALQILEQFKPDVLISDIGMPDIDGYMLMQQIKQLPPERRGLIRAIALTAYAGELNKQKAFQAGFHKHLSKPVAPFELLRTIASLVGRNFTR